MKNVDLLLIRPNDMKKVYGEVRSSAACEPPYWAAIIASFSKQQGYSVDIYDAEAYNASIEDVLEYIRNEATPKLIGLIITGTNLSASTWKMQGGGELAKVLNSTVNCPIFMWGLHPSALPEQTLREEAIDYVIKGEGLHSICDLLSYLLLKKPSKESIKGLYYFEGNEIKGNPNIDITIPEEFPMPLWEALPMELYKAHNWHLFGEKNTKVGNYAVIATSLGCPFQCEFCAVSALFGMKKVRFLDPKQVISMIDELVLRYHTKYIKILDECFVLNKKFVHEICDLLIERNYDLNIWAYARVDTVDEEILDKLFRAGIRWIAYGIESGSERSLADVAKGQYSNQAIEQIMKMTQVAGIYIMANFIFGLPEDDLDSMKQTLDLAIRINPEFINFYCTMAYPGSELYIKAIAGEKELSKEWLTYSQFSYECEPQPTNYLSAKEVLAFRDYAFEEFFRENSNYFDMVRAKFGEETVVQIREMLENKLERRLLEQSKEEFI